MDDQLTMIATALVAGAATGVSATASVAVRDAYTGLRDAARRLLSRAGGQPVAAVEILDAHDADPTGQHNRLTAILAAAGAEHDADLVSAAQRFMTLVDPGGAQAGKYTVNLRDTKGAQVGDGNSMTVNL